MPYLTRRARMFVLAVSLFCGCASLAPDPHQTAERLRSITPGVTSYSDLMNIVGDETYPPVVLDSANNVIALEYALPEDQMAVVIVNDGRVADITVVHDAHIDQLRAERAEALQNALHALAEAAVQLSRGKKDIAVVNASSFNVSILLGNGNGTMSTALNYATGSFPHSVAVNDFDGDGKSDLVVANYGSDNISILLGNGDGTFVAAANYSAGAGPFSVAVGDFNHDSISDLAVANANSNKLSVLLGNGDGTFTAAVNYATAFAPLSVAAGDFNGDGRSDLAVADYGSNNVSILLGNGDGTFAAAVNYAAGSAPFSLAVGDFNHDGRSDLAVANSSSNNVSILLGNGDGTFAAAVNYPTGLAPSSVAVGDFNSDGKSDLVVANASSNNVSILLGNNDGTFAAPVSYPTGSDPDSVAIADFNGDGKSDLAVANNVSGNVSILRLWQCLHSTQHLPSALVCNSRALRLSFYLPCRGSGVDRTSQHQITSCVTTDSANARRRCPTHYSSRRAAVRLARRFRGSRRATLRVAQPRARGRTRLSGRPLAARKSRYVAP